MATNSPSAVSMSASAIPTDTAPMLPVPVAPMPTNALITPMTVPSSPTNGAGEHDLGEMAVTEVLRPGQRDCLLEAAVLEVLRHLRRIELRLLARLVVGVEALNR